MVSQSTHEVALVCANSLVREGLRRILDEEGFSVGKSYKNCAALLTASGNESLDDEVMLVLIDNSAAADISSEISSLRAQFSKAHLVLLSDSFEFEEVVEAFRAGADGYIVKEIACESLLGSLRLVALGEKVLPSELIDHLPDPGIMISRAGESDAQLAELLSEREIETLRCLIMGYPNKVIAHRLDISEATVKVHVKAILRKLMVQNRTQAAIWAVNNGLDANVACATVVAQPDQAPQPLSSPVSAEKLYRIAR